MFGLFGPRVPKQLNSDTDFSELEKVIATRSARKIFKALRLVEESGTQARRAVPTITPLLDTPQFCLATARALWRVERNPEAPKIIRKAVGSPQNPNQDALLALSMIAKDDQTHAGSLLEATQSLIEVLGAARGSGDPFDKVFNAFTSGDDNTIARQAAATLAGVAWDHDPVKKQLAGAVKAPKNDQQKKYAALALGFTCYQDRKKMEEQMNFMNTFFDHPDIAMSSARNKIRADAISAGLGLAGKLSQ